MKQLRLHYPVYPIGAIFKHNIISVPL